MILRFNTPDEVIDNLNAEDSIYHFTKKSTALEFILNSKSLRFGSFRNTNDPQEYKRRMTSAVGWGWEEEDIEHIGKVSKSVDSIIKSSGFLSFCQNRYEKGMLKQHGCLKSRMWSQYGDDHSGICLVFSKRLLVDQIKRQFEKSHVLFSKEVTYKDPYESRARKALRINGGEIKTTEHKSIAFDHVVNDFEKIFFQKQPDYQDENEFRVVALAKDFSESNGMIIDISTSLKLVILGDKFPRVYLPTVEHLLENAQYPFRKLHWEKHSYLLLKK